MEGDVIPLSIADMDFAPDPAIVAALAEQVRQPLVYPLPYTTSGVAASICDYYQRAHHVTVPVTAVRIFQSSVAAMYTLFDLLLETGDEVVYFAPSYHHLPDSVKAAGGRAVPVMLRALEGWHFDVGELRRRVGPRTKALLVCNPHNPTGHAFSRAQLLDIATVAAEHDLMIVANELHGRISYDGAFVPMCSVAGSGLITLSGATKSHNISGLGGAFAFSLDEQLIHRLWKRLAGRLPTAGALALTALVHAYKADSPWLTATLAQLDRNRRTISAHLRDHHPAIRFAQPSATYFSWLDFSALRLDGDAAGVVLNRCRVALLPGQEFGAPGTYARLAFATTEQNIRLALARLTEGLLP
ncbi:aminotransferase class I/II-fold pyridoxal phosphate-dependent enzyme [Streptosporangium sp. NPDC006007]|uniref:aminotransferase class I/II-fold pyridoxal phosphate-dependent enzyme n=1 Tax=Streptosporangium sp. NPDC006007 TaxID=3154575 RepID=UPI00339E6B6B